MQKTKDSGPQWYPDRTCDIAKDLTNNKGHTTPHKSQSKGARFANNIAICKRSARATAECKQSACATAKCQHSVLATAECDRAKYDSIYEHTRNVDLPIYSG